MHSGVSHIRWTPFQGAGHRDHLNDLIEIHFSYCQRFVLLLSCSHSDVFSDLASEARDIEWLIAALVAAPRLSQMSKKANRVHRDGLSSRRGEWHL